MCLTLSNLYPLKDWNWDGDQIVHDTIIPGTRKTLYGQRWYEVDIREFLLFKDNAVIKRELARITKRLSDEDRWFFQSHETHSFDFRVQKILEYVSRHIAYQRRGLRGHDHWLFPEETLELQGGDCEDRAFLLAAMILASGVSSYVVRVALGKLYDHDPSVPEEKKHSDHVWVMYKNEAGVWMLLEGMVFTRAARKASRGELKRSIKPTARIEYIPYFVFNDAHLWQIDNNTAGAKFKAFIVGRMFWRHFNPTFGAAVHNSIFDEALQDLPWAKRQWLKMMSLYIDTLKSYDPRDHFDNGYILESWRQMEKRIETKTLNDMAYATHALADFYAHSSYACFARTTNGGGLTLFDGAIRPGLFRPQPDYGQGDFDMTDASRFSINQVLYGSSDRRKVVRELNADMIISGRFAQPDDPVNSDLIKFFINIPYVMRRKPEFHLKGGLPHHDEVAIDGPLDKDGAIPKKHRLYGDPAKYQRQFELRRSAAVRHIRSIFGSLKPDEVDNLR